MNERVYNNGIARLRSPERVERLEVEKVVDLCLENRGFKSVLDIGTGSGLFAEAFNKKGLTVAGVDLNPEMIEAAKSYLPDSIFEQSTAEDLPFDDNSFDIVFIGVLLHEVNDFVKALSEAKRVAKHQVSVLEWSYKVEDFGPPLEHRLSKDFLQNLSDQVGFLKMEVAPLKNLVLYHFIK
jgi:ubiquinone/menaquinone biosynthesis C-methylase UbiE